MGNTKQSISRKWQVISFIFVFFFIAIITQDIIREIVVFNQETKMIKNELDKELRKDISELVDAKVNQMENLLVNSQTNLIVHSSDKLTPIILGANVVLNVLESEPANVIEDAVIKITQDINLLDTEYEYSVYKDNGHRIYNGETDTIGDVDETSVLDQLNRPYIEDFMEIISSSEDGTGYVLMFLEEAEKTVQYVLYGEVIEGTDMIITIVANLDQYVLELRDETMEHFDEEFTEGGRFIYVITSGGDILFHQTESLIGENMVTIDDETVNNVYSYITNFLEENDSGFLEYEYFDDYDGGELKTKIAYVSVLEEWDIIVGSSVNEDFYTDIIGSYTRENTRLVLLTKIPSYIVIIILSLYALAYLRSNIKLSLQILEEEEILYRTFADMTSEMIMITNKQGEIIFTNKLGKKNIFGQRLETRNVYFDQILVEEEGYYILYGYVDDFFVKFVSEEVMFENEPADLFMITDVTEKIKTERKLEALSLKDELTSLGNRRMMAKEYNDLVVPAIKQGQIGFLAILDLDNFKSANDTYGHSYGDQVLKDISQIFDKNKISNTLFYRIGGDEFAILFVDVDMDTVSDFLEGLKQQIIDFPYEKKVDISFSAGVTKIQIQDKKRRFSDYFDKADNLLYKSKNNGRNKILFK